MGGKGVRGGLGLIDWDGDRCGTGGEGDGGGAASIVVVTIFAEGRDLVGMAASLHEHDPEMRADGVGLGVEAQDLVGPSARGDIVIFRRDPAEEVAHAATRKAGLMPGGKELADDGNGGGFHRRSAQGMRIPRSAAVTLRMPPSAFMSSKCHHSDSMTRKPAFFIAVWRRVTRRAISGSPPV